jgi:GDSL-like Lipase/Acylhydrolase family
MIAHETRQAGRFRRPWIFAAVFTALLISAVITTAFVVNHGKFAADTVFMGDSLTEMWDLPAVNFGGYGNTTDQMLARFNEVTDGQFMRAVILGGTNDVLYGVAPETTIGNLHEMIRLSTNARLETIVGTIPPIYWQNGRYQAAVDDLNVRIRKEVQNWNTGGTKVILVDYNRVLRGRREALTADGVHLRRRGYLLMEMELLGTLNPFLWKSGHRYPDFIARHPSPRLGASASR